jgi:hypothetical protein
MVSSQHGVCQHCPHGSISSTYNAVSCIACPDGFYAVAPATECTDCAPGQYHATTGESCTDCQAGRFAEGVATTECLHCPSGKFQNAAAYHECDVCAYGKWTADSMIGLTECVLIPTPYPTPYPSVSPTKAPTAPKDPWNWVLATQEMIDKLNTDYPSAVKFL